MAIRIQNTTAIDDNKNFYLSRVNMSDATYVNASGGGLRFQLDNPNAFNDVLNASQFGGAIAANETYFAVGSRLSPSSSTSNLVGAVHVYDQQTMKLLYSLYGTSSSGNFGKSISMTSTHMIVGASGESGTSGKAYVYNVTTGQLLWTLDNPNAYSTGSLDYFGDSVAISGNYAIVGASNEDDAGGTDSGKAYIFNVTTGALVWTLDNPNAYSTNQSDYFGSTVGISGNYAIVGAVGEDDSSGTSSGKAYIYNVTTGQLVWTLNNPNAYGTSTNDFFGNPVAISGNYAIVSVPNEDDAGGTDSGKAYIYNVTTGALVWTLNNPNAYSTGLNDYFGTSVAISGNYAIVGANGEDDAGGTDSGKAYIYNVTTGALVWTLNNPNAYSTSSNDQFGYSVAVSGTYAFVGAHLEDPVVNNSQLQGAVYSFKLDTGLPYGRVTAPVIASTRADDYFGNSVDVSGNYVIVGANQEDDGNTSSGKAYIFNVTTGQLVWTLNNPNTYGTSVDDNFGHVVAISGNYAIVGAYGEDDSGGTLSGKAYIYNVTTGQLVWTLNNPNAYSTSLDDVFGVSVAISGNYIIVGANGEADSGGTLSGKAYIFNVTTGQLIWTLNNPNAYSTSASDRFGYSVGISGNYAIVAASNEADSGGTLSGKAYIFNVTTGQLLWTLNNPNAYSTSFNDNFRDVAISGNYAIVGAYLESDTGGTNSGKAYIFNVTTGALVWTLNNPNAYSTSASDYFGTSVAISGNYAVVGATFEDDSGGFDSGKAYIFNVTTGQLVWTLNNPNAYGTSASDYFGIRVKMSGNYIVISARNENDTTGSDSGKAYIFNIHTPQIETASSFNGLEKLIDNQTIQTSRNTLLWTLNNPNAYSTSESDQFGISVSISGNYAIVGAQYEDDASGTDSGKAYIFNATTGQLLWTLNNPNASGTATNDYFGNSVAISGNYAIVGAFIEDDASVNSGKAYIYNAVTGALLFTLNNPGGYGTGQDDWFGYSVAISGNYAIVSAHRDASTDGQYSGKAYIYNAATGALVNTLNNPNVYSTAIVDYFGYSVAISGNYAIVGTNAEDDAGGIDSGKAYIYNVTTGALVWTLNNPNAYSTSLGDYFGNSVAISGNYAIVGALNEDDVGGGNSGKAYIFNVTTGQLLWTLNNPTSYSTSESDQFGWSVAISGNYAIVGAYFEDDAGGSRSGKAYIFNVTTGALVWTLNNPNAYSTSADDTFGGALSISDNYIIVSAASLSYAEDDPSGTFSGKAYIYYINNYNSLEDKLLSLFN